MHYCNKLFIYVDQCESDPCLNGGTCNSTTDLTFTCDCPTGYTGNQCQKVTCALDPCLNGGTCTEIGEPGYMCDCGIEFTGQDCGIAIGPCALLTPNCNNGNCVDGIGNFSCLCFPGYTGYFCDIDIDECETAGCQNGECEDFINAFRCTCYLGWTGILCNRDINYCSMDSSRFGPCDDVGTRACIDDNSTYTCECVEGYGGYDCSIDIDPCDPNPCQNGGMCTITSITTFECTCSEGYTGNTCDIDLTPCDPHPCGNGNCTELDGGAYMCECSPPYHFDVRLNTCSKLCPLFTFRNQTTQLCQPCESGNCKHE